MWVCSAKVLTRVPEANEELGSLRPTWPLVLMPRIWHRPCRQRLHISIIGRPGQRFTPPERSAAEQSPAGHMDLGRVQPSGSPTVRWMVA